MTDKNTYLTPVDIDNLGKRFIQHLLAIDNTVMPAISQALWQDIATRYSEPVRAYHTLTHLQQLFDQFEQIKSSLKQPSSIALALFYHDIVYDPTKQDNELQSALFFQQTYANILPSALIKRICELIMLTATHQLTDHSDSDAAFLLDMDLSVLGADWASYERYAQAVCKEYAHVANKDYHSGRIAVLEGLLAHPRLYLTDDYCNRLEQQARHNIEREIKSLRVV